MEWTFGLIAVTLISLVSLVGVFTLSLRKNLVQRLTFLLISLAAGTLVGDVFLHILPELVEEWPQNALSDWGLIVIVGIIFFFVLEKVLHWHHHHHIDAKSESEHDHDELAEKGNRAVGWVNLWADGLHNFVDGMVLAAAFGVSVEVGIATALAIALHEIPQEVGDFGVLLHAGFKRLEALRFNFLSALLAVAGYITASFLAETLELEPYLLAFAAGGFIYVAVADLIPQLHEVKRWQASILQLTLFVGGVALMWVLTLLES